MLTVTTELFSRLYSKLWTEKRVKSMADLGRQLSSEEATFSKAYIQQVLKGDKAVSDNLNAAVYRVYQKDLAELQKTKTPASIDAGELIAVQRDLIESLKRSESHAIEAKEAYKEIARLKEAPAENYVTRERFDVAELRTQVLRAWTVETLSKLSKVTPKVLAGELGKRIEETLQIYMQGNDPVVNILSRQE